MKSYVQGLIALLTLVLSTACAASGGPASGPALPDGSAALIVENNNWSDASVYLVSGSGSHAARIGDVTSLQTRRLRIPVHALRTSTTGVRLEISLLGSNERYPLEPIQVPEGTTVHLSIENRMYLSRLVIR